MATLRQPTFAGQLRRAITLTSCIALLLAGAAFLTYDLVTYRRAMVDDLDSLARIIESTSAAAGAFEDSRVAAEVLQALRARPDVVSGGVYTGEGRLLAAYGAEAPELPSWAPPGGGHLFENGHLVTVRPVRMNEERIGAIFLESDAGSLRARLRRHAITVFVVLAASILVAFLISAKLQQVLTRPIRRLVRAARRVSHQKDYSIRVSPVDAHELDALTTAFNDMLSEIEARDEALRAAHDELEDRVEERTRELLQEVADRLEAERALRDKEEQLRQSQKMEAVGRLAGGIAHDFNNLLTSIMGYTGLMLKRLPPGDPAAADAREVEKAGERARSLTRQLLAFSRNQALEPRALDLGEIVTNMERMLERLIGEDIVLRSEIAADLGVVCADPGQLEQLLLNLVVNARDAMPSGGALGVRLRNVAVETGGSSPHPDMEAGAYVVLEVQDTGCGMDAETRSRVFEPFFTTKGQGKGTGLGLATVYGIVRQSGGQVIVESEPGMGTTFRIYLPVVDEVVPAGPTEKGEHGMASGTETVLLVEDEDTVRDLAREILEMAGYRVLAARHGRQALIVSRDHGGAIDLMVTDILMPHMTGRELYETLAPQRPGMKVLFMSGYTDDRIDSLSDGRDGLPFLQKPFTPDEFSRKVRDVLDAVAQERAVG